MGETWKGLVMDSVANFLSFSTPTHTLDFDNHSGGYGHSKTTLVRSLADSRKSVPLMGLTFETVPESAMITIFKIDIFSYSTR
jgi:hypothetical protein